MGHIFPSRLESLVVMVTFYPSLGCNWECVENPVFSSRNGELGRVTIFSIIFESRFIARVERQRMGEQLLEFHQLI